MVKKTNNQISKKIKDWWNYDIKGKITLKEFLKFFKLKPNYDNFTYTNGKFYIDMGIVRQPESKYQLGILKMELIKSGYN